MPPAQEPRERRRRALAWRIALLALALALLCTGALASVPEEQAESWPAPARHAALMVKSGARAMFETAAQLSEEASYLFHNALSSEDPPLRLTVDGERIAPPFLHATNLAAGDTVRGELRLQAAGQGADQARLWLAAEAEGDDALLDAMRVTRLSYQERDLLPSVAPGADGRVLLRHLLEGVGDLPSPSREGSTLAVELAFEPRDDQAQGAHASITFRFRLEALA